VQSISSSWRRECQGDTAGPVAVVGRNPDITAGTEPGQRSRNAGPRAAGGAPAMGKTRKTSSQSRTIPPFESKESQSLLREHQMR